MIPMMTKEEFEKVVEICTSADRNCGQCPLSKKSIDAADILHDT